MRRVSIDGQRATVRFEGQVPPTGQWLGVEWDEPSRGKHSGTHEGRQYFVCARPGAGSFVRATARVNWGVSLVEALRAKYGVAVGEAEAQQLYVTSVSNQIVPVQVVGFDAISQQQRDYAALRIVELHEALVASAGPPGDIAAECPNVEELDLGANLLPSWSVVADICRQLPHLRTLNLSHNRLAPLQNASDADGAFLQLRELFLNDTLTTWHEIAALLPWMPSLTMLHLRINEIGALTISNPSAWQNIQLLNLDDNRLDWSAVAALSVLPRLDQLWLNGNRIERVDGNEAAAFAMLQSLSIERNLLDDWASVDALNKCPKLTELRMRNNPMMMVADSCREFVIARVAGLTLLNGSAISARERRDAELYFLRSLAGLPRDVAAARCQRYDELLKIHGLDAVDAASVNSKDSTLRSKLIEITLRSRLTEQSVTKKLPGDLNLRRLRLMVPKLFPQVPPSSFALQLLRADDDVVPLDDEQRGLDHYGADSGAVILVDAEPKSVQQRKPVIQ